MRFQIEGVKAGTNQAMKFVVETPDAATAIAEGVKCGMEQVRATPVDAVPAAAPVAAGASVMPVAAGPVATGGGAKPVGKGLWIGVGAGVAVLVLVIVLVLTLHSGGGSGGVGPGGAAAGGALDPRVYLPEGAEKGSFVVLSANMPKVLKLGVVAKLLNDPDIVKRMEAGAAISPKDIQEVLLLLSGDLQHRPTILAVLHLTRDVPVESLLTLGGYKGSLAGMDTAFESEEDSKDISSEDSSVTKLSSGVYLVAVTGMSHRELANYLAKAGKRSPAVYPSGVMSLQDKVGGGDIVLFGATEASFAPDAPRAFAMSLGDQIKGEATFSSEAAAADLEQEMKEALASMGPDAPKVSMSHSGVGVSAAVSADVLAAGGPVEKILSQSLFKSRELANRTVSAANLKGIASACMIWCNDNADMFPNHPVQLLAADYVVPKMFVSRRTTTTPAEFTPAEIEQAKKDWHAAAAKLDAHNDYLYFAAGMKNNYDSSIVIACEKPAGMTDGINVAFGDAHVEFIRLADLPAAFEMNNAARREKKIPEIAMSGGLPVKP